MDDKLGYMRTCGICGGIDIGGKIVHRLNCRSKADVTVTRLLNLLMRANSRLDVALIHLKDHTGLLENLQDLKRDINKELNDDD